MRDPKRIQEILELVNQLWEKDQDMRFFQLIYNLQKRFSQQNDGRGQVVEQEGHGLPRIGYDLFGTEDDELIEFLKEHLKKDYI